MQIKSLLFFLLAPVALQAQDKKINLNSAVLVGVTAGESRPALQLQTINGVQYKTWSAGIGVGLDDYAIRSLPVFIDVRKKFSNSAKSAFVYVDGGYNFTWLSKENKESFITSAKGGFYYDAGVGYQWPVLKGRNLFISAGYSGKRITTTESSWIYIDYIWPGPAVPPDNERYYHYQFRRLSIKAGLRF